MRPEAQDLPRSPLGWLPFLWSRVLFVGQTENDSRVRPWALVVLLILPAIFLYPSRSYLLLEPDEGRYAQIPREMVASGDWVVPTLQGEPYLDKPPLFYWLVALCYQLFGIADSVARIVPALAVHGSILTVYLIGRRSLGERSAFLGALLLAVTPGFVGMARLLILDGLLTLWVTLSLFSAYEAIRSGHLKWSWWLLAATACGLGILTKGPIALILPLFPLIAVRWLSCSPTRVGLPGWSLFGLIALAVNLPWYIAIGFHEPVFLRYFFWEHNILRFVKPFDHLEPVFYYVPIVLAGMLPGTLLLISYVRRLISGRAEEASTRSPESGFFLFAGLFCLVFFSISGSKLPTYILPAFPPLALVLGDFIARSRWAASPLTRLSYATAGLLLMIGVYLAVPWYAKERSPVGRPELVMPYVVNKSETVICYPRPCSSVAFYTDRSDLKNYRSKETQDLIDSLFTRPRTIVLLTHGHSLEALRQALPPDIFVISEQVSFDREKTGFGPADKLTGKTPWGLCDVAVIEIRHLATWQPVGR